MKKGLSQTAAAALFGGSPSKATKKVTERVEVTSEEPKQSPIEAVEPITYTATQGRKGRPHKTDGSKGAYFVVDPIQLAKIQEIAHTNGLQVKQVVGKALAMFIESYEKKHGVVTISEKKSIEEL